MPQLKAVYWLPGNLPPRPRQLNEKFRRDLEFTFDAFSFADEPRVAFAGGNHAARTCLQREPLPQGVWEGWLSKPKKGLPDGEYAVHTGASGTGLAAWYGSPTDRYRHGILGDAIEAGSLHAAYQDGRRFSLVLPQTQVFEDRTPRITDLDGDGLPEIVTIRSYQTSGASVAVFGVRNGALVELAASNPIGRANRWLNIAGIADYAGRGTLQIAYVETPHIGGTLRFVEWQGTSLVQVAAMAGFSNHAIGSREQLLSADIDQNDDGRPDIAVPGNNRSVVKIVGFENGALKTLATHKLAADVDFVAGTGLEDGCIRFKLADRTHHDIGPGD